MEEISIEFNKLSKVLFCASYYINGKRNRWITKMNYHIINTFKRKKVFKGFFFFARKGNLKDKCDPIFNNKANSGKETRGKQREECEFTEAKT